MTALRRPIGPWSMPDAQVLLWADECVGPEWLEMRRQGIGGSDASIVAGVSRWGSAYELYLDKTGRLPEKQVTARMEAGKRLEPVMREWFTDEKGIVVHRAGLVASKKRPWQRHTLDGLTEDGGILESKTTGWRNADEWEDNQVADHAEIQVQHGLAVTGRTHAWVTALIDGWDFQIRRVERDEGLIDLITDMELDFWTRYVLADVEPPATAQSLDVLKARYPDVELESVELDGKVIRPLLERLTLARAQKTLAEHEVKTYDAAIRQLMGSAAVALVDGEPVATLKLTSRMGYAVESTSFRQLRIMKGKKK